MFPGKFLVTTSHFELLKYENKIRKKLYNRKQCSNILTFTKMKTRSLFAQHTVSIKTDIITFIKYTELVPFLTFADFVFFCDFFRGFVKRTPSLVN